MHLWGFCSSTAHLFWLFVERETPQKHSHWLNGSLNYQIDFAHISHLVFPMDFLIICDSTDKIFLSAPQFIQLPLSVTSVKSNEPGQDAAVHTALIMLFPGCFTGEQRCSDAPGFLSFQPFSLLLMKGLYPVFLCISSDMNPAPVARYDSLR